VNVRYLKLAIDYLPDDMEIAIHVPENVAVKSLKTGDENLFEVFGFPEEGRSDGCYVLIPQECKY